MGIGLRFNRKRDSLKKEIVYSPKASFCEFCPINHVTKGYVPLQLHKSGDGRTLLVGDASRETEAEKGIPFSGQAGLWLNNMLYTAGIRRSDLDVINTIGCQPPDNIYPLDRTWHATGRAAAHDAVAYCRHHHLQPALDKGYDKIIALGDHALSATTNRRGILVWRGSPLPMRGDNSRLRVLPALHPTDLARDSKLVSVTIGDFRKPLTVPPEFYNLYGDHDQLRAFTDPVFAFDFEWDLNNDITLCGISSKLYQCTVWGWRDNDESEFRRVFESATDLIGHNIIGADTKYFEKLGWNVTARMHDTMLKQHLVQPDFRHSLAFVSSVFTNKPFWKGRGEEEFDEEGNIVEAKQQYKTWNTAEGIPRELGGYLGCKDEKEAYRLYNARDTDASLQINFHLDGELKRYGLESLYWNVSNPIAYVCRDICDRGIRIDPTKVRVIRAELAEQITALEGTLPEGLKPYEKNINRLIAAPEGTYTPKVLKCKGAKKSGTAHEPITWEATTPGRHTCPTCGNGKDVNLKEIKRIKIPDIQIIRPWNSSTKVKAYAKSVGLKMRIDRKKKSESADKLTRKIWGREAPEFRILDQLKKFGTARSNFAKPEMEDLDRLYFNLSVHGTSEGRFSSSGKRKGIDPNIQNQPDTIRKIYIPDRNNYSFIELDYSGGENWLTAWLAQDKVRLQRLAQPGYSEHLELAKVIFDLPSSTTKKQAMEWDGRDLYDIAKHINHGSNYGMTHVKLQEYCEGEGYFFTEKQCRDFIQTGKELNPGTAEWQVEIINRAKADGYLRNAFGRMRWFSSRNAATQALAFLPASTLADIIIRAMIAHYPVRFAQEIYNLGLTITAEPMPAWDLQIQVHDSLVLQGPYETQESQVLRTKAIMEQPWAELNGFNLSVGVKVGDPGESWGELH